MPDRPGGVGSRREARERALALLYEAEAKGEDGGTVIDAQPIAVEEFAADLVMGVSDHRAELDGLISRTFPLERINEAIAEVRSGAALRNVIVFDAV